MKFIKYNNMSYECSRIREFNRMSGQIVKNISFKYQNLNIKILFKKTLLE